MSGISILFDLVPSIAVRVVALVCLVAPVDGPVLSVFEPPACDYCAGRRSIDLAARPGETVIAPIAGRVTFAGPVARTLYVSIGTGPYAPTPNPGSGGRTVVTVGRLATVLVAEGEWVTPGRTIGRAGAAPVSLSWRRAGRYTDPSPFLGRLVSRARLVPTDGTASRPARGAECRSPRSPR